MSVLLAAGLGILAAPAAASFPGANGEIAFTRSAPKLGGVDATTHLIEPTGRRERAISCSVPGRAHGVCGDYGPSFSPDGDWLLVINPDAGSGSPNHRLRIMRADGVDPRAVPLPVFPEAATWSPDGRQIAFSAPSPETQRQELFVVDVDGSDLRRLTVGGATNPAWSSRGRIAFVRDRAGGAAPDIYVVRPDGTGERRLTFRGGEAPGWSPHGSRLVFQRRVAPRGFGGAWQLFTLRSSGRGLRRLTRRGGQQPARSPNGRRIAFVRTPPPFAEADPSDRRLCTARTSGGDVRCIARYSVAGPDWRPR